MKNNKNEKTLGILAHLQKNLPPSKQPTVEAELDMELDPEDEEDEEMNLLKKKPAKKLMSPPSSY